METDNKSKARLLEMMGRVNPSFVNESSVNRIEHWINTHDIAGISSDRTYLIYTTSKTKIDNNIFDGENGENGDIGKYSNAQLSTRRIELKSTLLRLGYGVTSVLGSYLENIGSMNQTDKLEHSFIVVNLNNDPKFINNLKDLGEYYNQDSVLIKEHNQSDGYLIGTNNSDYPGFNNKINVGSFYKNVNAEYMSRINSQSFAFSPNDGNENVIHPEVRKSFNQRKDARSNSKPLNEENVCQYLRFETFKNQQINTKRVIDTISKSVLKELNMLK